MKKLIFALIIFLTSVTYGQNRPSGNFKLIAIQNKTTATLDSTGQEHGLTINFETDTTVTFKLSINSCMGSYHLDKEKINMKPGACTKVYGDTKLAMKFYKALGEIDKFRICKDELVLENFTWTLYLNRIE